MDAFGLDGLQPCIFFTLEASAGKEEKVVNGHVFSYVDALDKAADAAWLRNEAISNNIANADTPGYKRQDVSFEEEFTRVLNKVEYDNLDQRVYNLQLSRIEPRVYTDAFDYSYRMDGNNVDVDTENVYLAENQVTYNALVSCMQNEFSNLRTAMST